MSKVFRIFQQIYILSAIAEDAGRTTIFSMCGFVIIVLLGSIFYVIYRMLKEKRRKESVVQANYTASKQKQCLLIISISFKLCTFYLYIYTIKFIHLLRLFINRHLFKQSVNKKG